MIIADIYTLGKKYTSGTFLCSFRNTPWLPRSALETPNILYQGLVPSTTSVKYVRKIRSRTSHSTPTLTPNR
ncbi:hypothetical protein ACN38_g3247 [Penicillium nordicum]|uniref:Uncharacterized protein n=1 Tax=Penicillium nordicum TaxID=229535 RepID=A0A0M8PD96_9EURO|nr:hypothetical protein ACN38_g3247 [Penicillium nordicum]